MAPSRNVFTIPHLQRWGGVAELDAMRLSPTTNPPALPHNSASPTLIETDRAFTDLLQAVVVEFDLLVELVAGSALALGQLQRGVAQMPLLLSSA